MQDKIIGHEAAELACEQKKLLLFLMADGNSAGGMAICYVLEGLSFIS
jgi:hypothetical protein